MISYYLISVFKCNQTVQGKTSLTINVTHGGQFIATEKKHENYTIEIKQKEKWYIKADYYVGFLRAL